MFRDATTTAKRLKIQEGENTIHFWANVLEKYRNIPEYSSDIKILREWYQQDKEHRIFSIIPEKEGFKVTLMDVRNGFNMGQIGSSETEAITSTKTCLEFHSYPCIYVICKDLDKELQLWKNRMGQVDTHVFKHMIFRRYKDVNVVYISETTKNTAKYYFRNDVDSVAVYVEETGYVPFGIDWILRPGNNLPIHMHIHHRDETYSVPMRILYDFRRKVEI